MPKKLKGRTLWDFSKSIMLQNSKKMKGDPLVEKLKKKSHSAEKNLNGDPLVSSGIVTPETFLVVPWANRYNLVSSQNFVELL